jgi:glycosyltransferase involved in cell wall biosynthesis
MPSFYESFGMSALEALASGVPSIGTTTGGTVHIIRDGVDGFLVDPTDQEKLADLMLFLSKNPRKAQRVLQVIVTS